MKYFISLQKPSLEKQNHYNREAEWGNENLVFLSTNSDSHTALLQSPPVRTWRNNNLLQITEEFNRKINNDKELINSQIEFLEHRLAMLEHAQSLLMIEDSPGFEKLFKSNKKSDHKRIIYITEKLIEDGKFVMLDRMLSSINKQESDPKALGTLTRVLRSFKLLDKLPSICKLNLIENNQNSSTQLK